MEKMLELAAKHPPNEPVTRQIAVLRGSLLPRQSHRSYIDEQSGYGHGNDGTVRVLSGGRVGQRGAAEGAARGEEALDVAPDAVGHAELGVHLCRDVVQRVGQ